MVDQSRLTPGQFLSNSGGFGGFSFDDIINVSFDRVENGVDIPAPAEAQLPWWQTIVNGIMNPWEGGTGSREAVENFNAENQLPDPMGDLAAGAEEWIGRGAIIILGFIFVAIGLSLFRVPLEIGS